MPTATSYELLDLIGSGGMAELFRARIVGEQGFYKIVAIKRVLPQLAGDLDFVRMLVDEARTVSHLSHPNIAEIYELRRDSDGGFFIAMELVPGPSLGALLSRLGEQGRRLEPACALDVTIHLLEALDYAHHITDPEGRPLQVIHRDVSPDNVLITRDGAVKLVDFGLVKAGNRLTQTQQGTIKGKLAYMSPEQARGLAIDPSTDLFSAALVSWEALTGKGYYDSTRGDLELMRAVVEGQKRTLADDGFQAAPELEAALQRALCYEPGDRFGRASEFARELTVYHRRTWPDYSPSQLGALVAELFKEHFDELADKLRRYTCGELRPSGYLRPMPTEGEPVSATREERAETVISRVNPLPSDTARPKRPAAPDADADDPPTNPNATRPLTRADRERLEVEFGGTTARISQEGWQAAAVPPPKRRSQPDRKVSGERDLRTRRVSQADLERMQADQDRKRQAPPVAEPDDEARPTAQMPAVEPADSEEVAYGRDAATRLVSQEALQHEANRRQSSAPAKPDESPTDKVRRQAAGAAPPATPGESDKLSARTGLVVLALGVCALLVVGGMIWLRSREPAPVDPVRLPPDATLRPVPVPLVEVAGLDASVKSLPDAGQRSGTRTGQDAGARSGTRTGQDAGARSGTRAGPDAGMADHRRTGATAQILIDCSPTPCEVFIDGVKKKLPRDRGGTFEVSAGPHRVRLVGANQRIKELKVEAAVGNPARVRVDLHGHGLGD